MGVSELGRIQEVEIRTIWPDEALDFTPWLAKKLDLLSETLGIALEAVEQEEQGLADTTGANLNWNSIPSRVSGFRYYWSMERNRAQPVAVYLEMKTGDRDHEKKIFDSLKLEKSDIEESLGRELIWKGDAKKIQLMLQGEEAWINDPPEKLNQIREWILEHLLKLKQVFDPRLEEILGQSPPENG